jgi:hypothetical protein
MSWVEMIADRKVRDAQEEGAFDNLAGKGQPLKLDIDSRLPPEIRIANQLMRDAGVLPEWIELEKQIRNRRQSWAERVEEYARARSQAEMEPAPRTGTSARALRKAAQQQEAAVARYDDARELFLLQAARELRAQNALIDRFNLMVPVPSRQRMRLRLHEELAALEARFPRLRPYPEGVTPIWQPLLDEQRGPAKLGNRMPLRRARRSIG